MRIDPDIIVTQQGNGTADILKDPRIQDLKAVKNKAIIKRERLPSVGLR